MKNYTFEDDSILDAVRSLRCYYDYYTLLGRLNIDNPSFFLTKNPSSFSRYIEDLSDYNKFVRILQRYSITDFYNACRCVHNAYMRTTRVRKRINFMRDYYKIIYFVTLTINEESLQSFSFDSLLNSAKFYCKSTSSCYFLNPDFGDKLGRLHFHCTCTFDKLDSFDWPFGFVKIETVKFSSDELSERRIARYCTKLARHATKDSAFKVYFSRLPKI